MVLETQWENKITMFVCPFFISRMLLFMHHCPHYDACTFKKAKKKSIPSTFYSSALPFLNQSHPKGLIVQALLLPCYQQL